MRYFGCEFHIPTSFLSYENEYTTLDNRLTSTRKNIDGSEDGATASLRFEQLPAMAGVGSAESCVHQYPQTLSPT